MRGAMGLEELGSFWGSALAAALRRRYRTLSAAGKPKTPDELDDEEAAIESAMHAIAAKLARDGMQGDGPST